MHKHLAIFLIAFMAFATNARAVAIDWVPVGKPGNLADQTSYTLNSQVFTSSFGAVPYTYSIGKYDVTNRQYVEFLNSKDPGAANLLGLYASDMSIPNYGGITVFPSNPAGNKYVLSDGAGNYPVNFVSWYSAIRFSNWLNNGGQPGSDTETGSYTLLGGTPTPSNAASISRSATAHIVLPTEDEWYKAAYYNPSTGSYFKYPTSSDTAPTASLPTSAPNSANFGGVTLLTDVGAYSGTASPSQAFDMGGNVLQWNEQSINGGAYRGLRGDAFYLPYADYMIAGFPSDFAVVLNRFTPDMGLKYIGFRVAMVPEPSSLALAAISFAGLAAFGWRRRKALR